MSDKTVTVRTPGFGFFGGLALLLAAAKLFAGYEVSWLVVIGVAMLPLAIGLSILGGVFVFGAFAFVIAETIDSFSRRKRRKAFDAKCKAAREARGGN